MGSVMVLPSSARTSLMAAAPSRMPVSALRRSVEKYAAESAVWHRQTTPSPSSSTAATLEKNSRLMVLVRMVILSPQICSPRPTPS